MHWHVPREGPLDQVPLAVSMSQVLHQTQLWWEEAKMEGTAGRGVRVFLSLSYHKAISPSLGTLFSLFLLIFMVCSWAIALNESLCLQSHCAGPLLRGGDGGGNVELPALNVPWTLFSAVELASCMGSTVRSLSWDLKCVSKHWFGGSL